MSLATFARSNLASLFTTALDFVTLAVLAGYLGVDYVTATWLGTVAGATANFLLNKHWVFAARGQLTAAEPSRFILVQLVASGLHTAGVWALTRYMRLHYLESKIIVALVVYLAWNYPLNRTFVFRARRSGC